MAGVKGKSGKASTPAMREAKRQAGRAGGNAKAGRTEIPTTGQPFKVQGWVDRKDQLACLLLERKIAAADIDVETAATKRDLERGKLLTFDQVRERDDRHTAAFRQAVLSAVDLVPTWVPSDKILAAQAAFRAWADLQLETVAGQVKNG